MIAIGKPMIIFGVIVFVLGFVFILQSESVVGPASSFMYDNPEWTANGSLVIAIGIVIVTLGGFVLFAKRKRRG
jgi:LPXTG-motif cell wall-anchored protein